MCSGYNWICSSSVCQVQQKERILVAKEIWTSLYTTFTILKVLFQGHQRSFPGITKRGSSLPWGCCYTKHFYQYRREQWDSIFWNWMECIIITFTEGIYLSLGWGILICLFQSFEDCTVSECDIMTWWLYFLFLYHYTPSYSIPWYEFYSYFVEILSLYITSSNFLFDKYMMVLDNRLL